MYTEHGVRETINIDTHRGVRGNNQHWHLQRGKGNNQHLHHLMTLNEGDGASPVFYCWLQSMSIAEGLSLQYEPTMRRVSTSGVLCSEGLNLFHIQTLSRVPSVFHYWLQSMFIAEGLSIQSETMRRVFHQCFNVCRDHYETNHKRGSKQKHLGMTFLQWSPQTPTSTTLFLCY